MKDKEHERWDQKTDWTFNQSGESSRCGARKIAETRGVLFGLFGPITGKNGCCCKKAEGNVKNHGACIGEEQRCRGDGNRSKGRAMAPEFTPAKTIRQPDYADCKQRRWKASCGFRIAKAGQRKSNGFEIKCGLIEIVDTVVSGYQPGTRYLHFARYFSIPALIRLDQRQVAQSKTDSRPHNDNSD